ncbi:MAG: O-antigen ligase family protein [Ardenticatenaceae bacterium]|nr:O-antigen ligase family protein [Ardenticatenaceae bacterium]MCB9443938.1 O-antigen ligase family protein [Ardenticatenaceae bacterium]
MQLAVRLPRSKTRHATAYWLTVAVICLMPVQWFLLPFNLALADLALLLLLLLTLVQAAAGRRVIWLPLLGPALLILTASALGTAVGFGRMESVIAIMQEIYIYLWFIALVSQVQSFTGEEQDRLLRIWAIVACLEAVTTMLGMWQIGPALFYTKPARDTAVTTEITRAVGLHANSNAAAVYLSVSFFAALATRWPRRRRYFAAAWIYAGMIGTGSNGALLSTLVGVAAFIALRTFFHNKARFNLWAALIMLTLGVSILLLMAFSFLSVNPQSRIDSSDQILFYTIGRFSRSLTSRMTIIDWAWRIYKINPLGVGPNGFATLQGSLHNDYVAFWFERGLLGLIGWVWLIWASFQTALQTASQALETWRGRAVLILGCGLLACALNAFSHEISHMRQLWLLIVFLFALSVQKPEG